MSEPTTSLRDAISAALDTADEQVPAESAQPSTQEAVAPAPAPAVDDVAGDAEAAPAPAAEAQAGQDLNALAEGENPGHNKAEAQPRDEQGKFKQKSDTIQPGPKSGPKTPDRAPASWRPDVREHWGQLPETVRSEIARRETEVQRTLQETAEARKTAEAVMRTISPYEAFIKAENSNPLQAIDNLMSTAARLRTGTAPELASLMSQMINQFGIGRFGNSFIEQLDSALAGQTPRVDPQVNQLTQVVQQQLAPVQQFMTQFQQMQAQQAQRAAESARNEVEHFLQNAEFGEDVREEMADILEVSQKRGRDISLQEAYKQACFANDRVRAVIAQRVQAQGAQQQTQAAQRARSAAVSVSGSAPMGALRQDPTDVRSAIEAAIAMSLR